MPDLNFIDHFFLQKKWFVSITTIFLLIHELIWPKVGIIFQQNLHKLPFDSILKHFE